MAQGYGWLLAQNPHKRSSTHIKWGSSFIMQALVLSFISVRFVFSLVMLPPALIFVYITSSNRYITVRRPTFAYCGSNNSLHSYHSSFKLDNPYHARS